MMKGMMWIVLISESSMVIIISRVGLSGLEDMWLRVLCYVFFFAVLLLVS